MNFSAEGFQKLLKGVDLSVSESKSVFLELVLSEDVEAIAKTLKCWQEKGATSVELAACAGLMRKKAATVMTAQTGILDVVGTGGSTSKLFNVSTAAAFVAAGAGVAVAKHGNRAATSSTGSADAISILGVNLAVDAVRATEILNKIGICFMFAPKFHNLKPELAAARKTLSTPSIFNQLGPLANPAAAPFQLIGVSNSSFLKPMAEAVIQLGTKTTWIVHGDEGLDEISLSGSTQVAEIRDGASVFYEIVPEQFGIRRDVINPVDQLTPEKSASIIRGILGNRFEDSPFESIVVLNAAAAIFIADGASNWKEAAEMAFKSIRTGAAMSKLNQLLSESGK